MSKFLLIFTGVIKIIDFVKQIISTISRNKMKKLKKEVNEADTPKEFTDTLNDVLDK